MKKVLVVLAVAALTATIASAATNIISGNVVGYGRVNVPQGQLRLIGCNFQTTSSGNTFSIQDLFNKDELFKAAVADMVPSANSDQISVFNGATYDTCFFGTFDGAPAWLTAGGALADKTFLRGDAFWFKRMGATTNLTLAGQAPMDPDFSRLVANPGDYRLFSYAYPKAAKFNDLGITGAYRHLSGDAAKSDQILVFNGNSYSIYVYGWDEVLNHAAWLDKNGSVANVGLDVATAAWYKRAPSPATALTWNESKPY